MRDRWAVLSLISLPQILCPAPEYVGKREKRGVFEKNLKKSKFLHPHIIVFYFSPCTKIIRT